MVATSRVLELFADARFMHGEALERLAEGHLRDAAERAWYATKHATDALILSRTGEEPVTTARATDGLDTLADRDREVKPLVGRYFSRISQLHGACFYDGKCNDRTERRIRETENYIADAGQLVR